MSHVHEKIDFTASIYVVYKDKVLLRMHDKYGIWLPPGGHIELNEDPVQAALREVKEESGLDAKIWDANRKGEFEEPDGSKELIPPVSLHRHPISDTHEHVNLAYFATTESDVLNPAEGEARDGLKWCTKDELDEMNIRKDIRFYAKLALETLGE